MPLTPGYNRAEALAIGRKIAARAEREARDQYREYAAEARACGYEVASFREWNGETSAKAEASERMAQIPHYMLDLY